MSTLTPHGACLLWKPELIWLNAVSDAMLAGAFFAIAFVVGASLAAFGAVVGTSQGNVAQLQDGQWLLNSLVVVIIGGLGSLVGAVAGSLLYGLVFAFSAVYLPTSLPCRLALGMHEAHARMLGLAVHDDPDDPELMAWLRSGRRSLTGSPPAAATGPPRCSRPPRAAGAAAGPAATR